MGDWNGMCVLSLSFPPLETHLKGLETAIKSRGPDSPLPRAALQQSRIPPWGPQARSQASRPPSTPSVLPLCRTAEEVGGNLSADPSGRVSRSAQCRRTGGPLSWLHKGLPPLDHESVHMGRTEGKCSLGARGVNVAGPQTRGPFLHPWPPARGP